MNSNLGKGSARWLILSLVTFGLPLTLFAGEGRDGSPGATDSGLPTDLQRQQQQQEQRARESTKGDVHESIGRDDSHQARHRKMRQVSGTIVDTKQVEIRGTDTKNTVVLLRASKGERRVIADLGPATALASANLRPGSRIEVQGRMVDLMKRPVLIASKVRSGGTRLDIRRIDQEAQVRHDRAARLRAPQAQDGGRAEPGEQGPATVPRSPERSRANPSPSQPD